ncbi:TPA: hypothetical protein ACH3X2_013100 [Trebouxia sp. C0005]
MSNAPNHCHPCKCCDTDSKHYLLHCLPPLLAMAIVIHNLKQNPGCNPITSRDDPHPALGPLMEDAWCWQEPAVPPANAPWQQVAHLQRPTRHQASSIRGPKARWGSFPAGNRVAARILFQVVNDNGHCQQGP